MFDFKPYYEKQRKTVTGFFGVCQNIFLTLIWNKTPVKSNILLCRDSARDFPFFGFLSPLQSLRLSSLFINSIIIRYKLCYGDSKIFCRRHST